MSVKPSDERNGCFLDKTWCCKVCDGEIPDGHTDDCDIWKLDKKHRDFIANEYSTALTERDALARRLAEAEAKLAIWEAACTGKHGSQVSCGEMAIALCRPESAGAPVDRTDERCSCKPLAVRGKATDLEVYCPQCGKVFRGAADNGTD